MAINEIGSVDFEKEIIEGSGSRPVVVDFWAPWCGPCRMIHPIMEELDNEYGGSVGFYKINTDESQDIASRYNVMSIPTLILFRDGDVKDTIVGVKSKAAMKKTFDEHLAD